MFTTKWFGLTQLVCTVAFFVRLNMLSIFFQVNGRSPRWVDHLQKRPEETMNLLEEMRGALSSWRVGRKET